MRGRGGAKGGWGGGEGNKRGKREGTKKLALLSLARSHSSILSSLWRRFALYHSLFLPPNKMASIIAGLLSPSQGPSSQLPVVAPQEQQQPQQADTGANAPAAAAADDVVADDGAAAATAAPVSTASVPPFRSFSRLVYSSR